MNHRTLIVAGFAIGLVVLVTAVQTRRKSDQLRWSELRHLGRSEAVCRSWHLQPLASHFQRRYESAEKSLLGSGYLVEIIIPVHGSRTSKWQIIGTITNMAWPHKASHWTLHYEKDEVQMTCRAEDVSLWRASLKEYQTP